MFIFYEDFNTPSQERGFYKSSFKKREDHYLPLKFVWEEVRKRRYVCHGSYKIKFVHGIKFVMAEAAAYLVTTHNALQSAECM